MSVMKKWLEWAVYTILAIIAIGILVSGGLVFLAIGATIGFIFLGGLLIAFAAYAIKDFWEHVRSRK